MLAKSFFWLSLVTVLFACHHQGDDDNPPPPGKTVPAGPTPVPTELANGSYMSQQNGVVSITECDVSGCRETQQIPVSELVAAMNTRLGLPAKKQERDAHIASIDSNQKQLDEMTKQDDADQQNILMLSAQIATTESSITALKANIAAIDAALAQNSDQPLLIAQRQVDVDNLAKKMQLIEQRSSEKAQLEASRAARALKKQSLESDSHTQQTMEQRLSTEIVQSERDLKAELENFAATVTDQKKSLQAVTDALPWLTEVLNALKK